MKHLKDNLPIFPDDPAFPQQFISPSSDDVVPSILRQSLPHEEEVSKQAKAAKQFFEEEMTQVKCPLQALQPLKQRN